MPLCPGLALLLRWFGRLLWLRHRSPIEHKLAGVQKPGGIGTPDILLLQCEELAVIDNLADRLFRSSMPTQPSPAPTQAAARIAQLQTSEPGVAAPAIVPGQSRMRSSATSPRLTSKPAVLAKEYIAAGDFMQVVIGQRLQTLHGFALSLYPRCVSNSSPYMYYYDLGDFRWWVPPEILVRQEHNAEGGETVTIRPIAGTRPRGPPRSKTPATKVAGRSQRSAPSTSCSSTSPATTSVASRTIGSVKSHQAFGSSATRMSCTSSAT